MHVLTRKRTILNFVCTSQNVQPPCAMVGLKFPLKSLMCVRSSSLYKSHNALSTGGNSFSTNEKLTGINMLNAKGSILKKCFIIMFLNKIMNSIYFSISVEFHTLINQSYILNDSKGICK